MKIKWEYTLFTAIITATLGLAISFLWIFNGFKATTNLPKTVSVFEKTAQGKKRTVGTLKFESGIKKQIDSAVSKSAIDQSAKKDDLPVEALLFHYNPYILIWAITIVILIGLAAGAVPLIIDRIVHIRKELDISWKAIGIMIAIVVALGLVMAFSLKRPSYLIYYTFWTPFADVIFTNHHTMSIVVTVILAFALPALLGIATLFLASQKFHRAIRLEQAEVFKEFDTRYLEIREALTFFLIVLTSLITLTVLATGAFRKALLSAISVEGLDLAPIEFVYLYGVFFTIFLALFYAPVYFQLLSLKHEVKTNPKLSQFRQSESLNVSNWQTIKILASLLAPLLSSFLPGVLS